MASPAPCLSVAWRDVDDVLAAWGGSPGFACLDSGGPVGPRARWTIICRNPVRWIAQHDGTCWLDGTPVAHDLPCLLRQCVPGGACPPAVPFAGGAIGFIGYGAGQRMEGIGTRHGAGDDGPEAAFGVYDHAFVLDRETGRAWLAGTGLDGPRAAGLVAQWAAIGPAATPLPLPALRFRPDQDGAAYRAAVAQAVARIAAGEVFQVNITGRMQAARPPGLAAVDVYRTLRVTSPAPFGAFVAGRDGFALLGASPERFLSLDGAGRVSTRPIKGTAARGATAQDDARLAHALRHDPKEQAENLMIVDLMRNDIGRVAQLGSIAVPELFAVEQFAHVHHLVSEITGRLGPGRDAYDLLAATVPPGSVTGAPKHRAMQVIDALEASPRGAYCGTVVRIGCDGAMDSAVIIRTLVLTRDHVTAAAGGGITVESDPEREYREMQLKIAALLALFGPQAAEGNMP
ncbi:anthranilate synthase component I family protein [Komagataeibacter sp. AV436]|uniref:Anthranilate synthase component I family protein n=1 Tax=Komagataeibacter melomenusus TaxID=2766578 RepID=A0ABX2AA13_9PROT|nr:anthranilate synthase component I family protein [Komagataeibacter melomenusus]NPC65228.1 anthranilate synthase component I family protein [Komagataeibacter melomenusus]